LLSSNRQWVNYEKTTLPEADLVITIIEEARERIINLEFIRKKSVWYRILSILRTFQLHQNRKDDSFIIFYGGAINKHRDCRLF